MSGLHPFRAGLYNDPGSKESDGVLDVSGILQYPNRSMWPPEDLVQPDQWRAASDAKAVIIDPEPALYMIRVGWRDDKGRPWQRSGVVGTTTPATGALCQPTTTVVSDSAFGDLLVPEGIPLLRGTALDGKHYRVWALRRGGVLATISDAVDALGPPSTSPFVLATTDFFVVPSGFFFLLPEVFLANTGAKSI